MSVRTKTSTKKVSLLRTSTEALRQLRKMRGIFVNKGPKDTLAWQRRSR